MALTLNERKQKGSSAGIQSVRRALTLLSLFTRRRTRIGVTEISRELGVTKGAAHSLVSTLLEAGFLSRDAKTRKYVLGLKVFEIGMLQPQTQDLNQHATGPAMELTRSRRLITRVAIWDGEAVLVTLTIYPQNRPEISSSAGPRLHAYSTGLGKAVLANLPIEDFENYLAKTELIAFTPTTITDNAAFSLEIKRTRERGYSIDREESVLGMACLGAPIFGANNEVMGALSLSGSSKRILNEQQIDILAGDLLRTADEISRGLGRLPKASVI
jgi:DNA-binding IclR family transcriptional regulator